MPASVTVPPTEDASILSKRVQSSLREKFGDTRTGRTKDAVEADHYYRQVPQAARAACDADHWAGLLSYEHNLQPLKQVVKFSDDHTAGEATARGLFKGSFDGMTANDWRKVARDVPGRSFWPDTLKAGGYTKGSEWEYVFRQRPSARRDAFVQNTVGTMLASLRSEGATVAPSDLSHKEQVEFHRHCDNLLDPESMTHDLVVTALQGLHPVYDDPKKKWPVLDPLQGVLESVALGRKALEEPVEPHWASRGPGDTFSFAKALEKSVQAVGWATLGRDPPPSLGRVRSLAEHVTHASCSPGCSDKCSIASDRSAMARAITMIRGRHTTCVSYLNELQNHYDSLRSPSAVPSAQPSLQPSSA